MNHTKYLLLTIALLILIGCASTKYITRYEAYLEKSDPPHSLHFSDANFNFNFYSMDNGIGFSIENLNNRPAFLLWDRCYFIEPNGNSSKALNTDLLCDNAETTDKSKYESPIPSKGLLQRFTTSANNLHSFEIYRNFGISFSDGIITINNSASAIEKFTLIGHYWPAFTTPALKDSIRGIDTILKHHEASSSTSGSTTPAYTDTTIKPHHVEKIDTIIRTKTNYNGKSYIDTTYKHTPIRIDTGVYKISNFIKKNNHMGLGLGIKVNESTIDYKFDFKVSKVTILKIVSTGNHKDTVIYKTAADTLWQWK